MNGASCSQAILIWCAHSQCARPHRANGYYSSFTYFSSKILFDILPLRIIPPIVFGGITYAWIGLVPEVSVFWKFLLTLVLFNLTTASVILLLSIAFESTSVASLVGTLIMLFKYVSPHVTSWL